MIYFSELLEQLQSAEFSKVSITDMDTGVIKKESYNRLISLVNAGCAALYRQFELKNSSLLLRTTKGKVRYVLESEQALSNNPTGYIVDTVDDPFLNDVMEIKAIQDLEGRELILNNYRERVTTDTQAEYTTRHLGLSFFTLDYRTLRIPHGLVGTDLVVNYRCNFVPIKQLEGDPAQFDVTSITLAIPPAYLNALSFYMASRLANAQGAETIGRGIFHQGNNYQQKYEAECAALKQQGLEMDIVMENDGIRRKGFV